MIKGHIFNADLNEYHFVYDSIDGQGRPVPVELGEILVVEDNRTQERFLIRVTNIQLGQDPKWQKEVARSLNLVARTQEDPEEFYQQDRREQLYNVAICEVLGFINEEDAFCSPKRIVSYFSKVRKLNEDDFSSKHAKNGSLQTKLGDVQFANIRSGSQVLSIKCGLFKSLFEKHIGVFAQTGGGKSNTVQVLCGTVMDLKGEVGMLLLEPHGEYMQVLKDHPLKNEQLIVYNTDGRGKRNLRISHQDIGVDAVMNLRNQMSWSEPQERFMREVEGKFSKEWFRIVTESAVTLEDFDRDAGGPEFFLTGKNPSGEFKNAFEDSVRVTQMKLNRLKRAGDSFLTEYESNSTIPEILSYLDQGKVVLIDMSALSEIEELFISTILTSKILQRRKRAYRADLEGFQKLPPISIVMEEAQRVLGRSETGSSVFSSVCNEGRKFKTGLIAITQQPKLMSEVLLSQFNTLVILAISDEKDFDILSSISKKPIDKLKREIRQLMPGEALITNPLSPFALPVKVQLWEEYLKKAKLEHVEVIPYVRKGTIGII